MRPSQMRGTTMATFTTPVLRITGSPIPGKSDIEIEYFVTFDKFDKFDYPYRETVRLLGDDTSVAGDPAAAAPDDVLYFAPSSTIRASDIVAPATTLKRTHTVTLSNTSLDEDKLAIPNPDEIRAAVYLTPVSPVQTAQKESNLVTLTLP